MMKLAFSPDGQKLFHSTKGRVSVWSLENKGILYKCPGSLFAISDDSLTFLSKKANVFQAWDSETGNLLELEEINPDSYEQYRRSKVIADRENERLIIKDALNIHPPISIELGDTMASVDHWVLSPKGKFIAIAYYIDIAGHDSAWGKCMSLGGETLFGFDVNRFTSKPLLYFAEHHSLLAVETRQYTITLYLTNGKAIKNLKYSNLGGRFIHIGPRSDRVIAIHHDWNSFRIVSNTNDEIFTESDQVLDVAFHPDGYYIASLLKSGEIRVYDLKKLKLEDVFQS